MESPPKKVSIIIPIYNEEGNIKKLYETLYPILESLNFYRFELIFVNDGSKDSSLRLLKEIARRDSRIKVLSFSRNFGHQMALSAGYDYADGEAIITMDADMQDPPELICALLQKWENGFNIVYARRSDRSDSFLKKCTAHIYYKLLDAVSDVSIPRNVGDFRLIDKKVAQELKQSREKSPYLRGLVAWTGFSHTFIDFKRPNRNQGITGYTWKKMFKLAFDGLTGFSLFPLKIAAFMGMFVIGTGVAMFTYITIDALMFKVHYPLFKWLVTIIYIFMGIQFLLLWLIGEYIGRIFEQQKGRSLYIIDEKINVK